MPPKEKRASKRASKRGSKKDKEANKLTQVDRTFYELTITDLNQKLARLRAYITNLDESTAAVTEKLRELEYDRTDIASHLERTLTDRNNTIVELEERLVEISKVRDEENRVQLEKISELEHKYKSMYDQLTSEIKLLNGKLNSLDEFRIQRDRLLARFDEQAADILERARQHKEDLYNMDQRAVLEKDTLKKNVEEKLLQVSEDFTRSSEIRNAGYTRRLIRENIALQKEMDKLITSQLKIQQQFNNQQAKQKEMVNQYELLDQIRIELVRNSINKIKIIEGLTKNYEKLKEKYVETLRYRKAYEKCQEQEICERAKQKTVSDKTRILSKRIEILKLEKTEAAEVHKQHETEIIRLQAIIEKIKNVVTAAIKASRNVTLLREHLEKTDPSDMVGYTNALEAKEDAVTICNLRRGDLLSELKEIVTIQVSNLPRSSSIASLQSETTSVYKPGKIGFMKREKKESDELFALFEKAIEEKSTESDFDKGDKLADKKAIMDLKADLLSIIDVEWGSTFFVSSSREEDIIEVEEEPLEEADEGSSSSVSVQKASKQPSVIIAPGAELTAATEPPPTTEKKSSSADMMNLPTIQDEEADEEEEFEIHFFY